METSLPPPPPPNAGNNIKTEAPSMDDLLRQAELLTSQMQDLGLSNWTETSTAANGVSSDTTASQQQETYSPILKDNRDHQSSLNNLNKSLKELEEKTDTDQSLAAQFLPSLVTAKTPLNSTQPEQENEQSFDALLEQAEVLTTQLKSSGNSDGSEHVFISSFGAPEKDTNLDSLLQQAEEQMMKSSAFSVESRSTSNESTPLNFSDSRDSETNLDSLLQQAEELSAQMKSSAHSVGSKHSAGPNKENEKELDDMLGQAEKLAAQMESAARSVNSSKSSTSPRSVEQDENVTIDDMLRRAEALAAEIKSESQSVGSKSRGESSKQTPKLPLNSTPRDASGIPASAVRRALASPPTSLDTPTLIRESESLLGAGGTGQASKKAVDTPALMRQANALLATSNGSTPASPVETALAGDDILERTDALIAMMQSQSSEHEKSVTDSNVGVAAPSTPKMTVKGNTDIMERAMSALREASAQCSTPPPPEFQTPTSVNLAPVMDEVSSVGSGSVRSFSSFGNSPLLGSTRKAVPLPPRRSSKQVTDRPPVAPRVTPFAEKNAVDAVLEETKRMALTLQQMSGAKPSQDRANGEKKETRAINTPDDGKLPALTAEMLASFDNDKALSALSSAASSPSKHAVDPCLEFEKEALKADPHAKFVKVKTASVGDDDYALLLDYYTPKKKQQSAIQSVPRSDPYTSRKKQEQPRNIIFRVVAALVLVLIVVHLRTWDTKVAEPSVSTKSVDTDIDIDTDTVRRVPIKEKQVNVAKEKVAKEKKNAVHRQDKKSDGMLTDCQAETEAKAGRNLSDTQAKSGRNHSDTQAKADRFEKNGTSNLPREPMAATHKPNDEGPPKHYLEKTTDSNVAHRPVLPKLKRMLIESLKSLTILGLFALPLKLFLLS